MITGYNTDVRHRNLVFHVQTEDKGAANPLIESLVYVGGQVLAARRASYSTLLAEGGDREGAGKAVLTLMDRQHRTMIAAIRGGRFDDKVAALLGGDRTLGGGGEGAVAVPAAAAAAAVAAQPRPRRPAPPAPRAMPPAAAAEALEFEVDEEPPTADLAAERTLDQVILEYLTSEAEQEHLELSLDEASTFALGERAYLLLRAASSRSGDGVSAQVSVRMISTVDEPKTLAQGETDGGGTVRLVFEIPALGRGAAALIISAASAIGRAEIKQLL